MNSQSHHDEHPKNTTSPSHTASESTQQAVATQSPKNKLHSPSHIDTKEKELPEQYLAPPTEPPIQRARANSSPETMRNEPPPPPYYEQDPAHAPRLPNSAHSNQVMGGNVGMTAGMLLGEQSGNMVGGMLEGQVVGGWIGQQVGRAQHSAQMREQARVYRGAVAAGVPQQVAAQQAGIPTGNEKRAGRAERRMKRWERREKRHEKVKGWFGSGNHSD